jgi:hypothetical protein
MPRSGYIAAKSRTNQHDLSAAGAQTSIAQSVPRRTIFCSCVVTSELVSCYCCRPPRVQPDMWQQLQRPSFSHPGQRGRSGDAAPPTQHGKFLPSSLNVSLVRFSVEGPKERLSGGRSSGRRQGCPGAGVAISSPRFVASARRFAQLDDDRPSLILRGSTTWMGPGHSGAVGEALMHQADVNAA